MKFNYENFQIIFTKKIGNEKHTPSFCLNHPKKKILIIPKLLNSTTLSLVPPIFKKKDTIKFSNSKIKKNTVFLILPSGKNYDFFIIRHQS